MTSGWPLRCVVALLAVSFGAPGLFSVSRTEVRALAELYCGSARVFAAPAPRPADHAGRQSAPAGRNEFGGTTSPVESKGKQIVKAKCVDCHDLHMVETARHTRNEWRGVLTAMTGRGARLTAEEASTVLDYLAANFARASMGASRRPGKISSSHRIGDTNYSFSTPPKRGTISGTVAADQGAVRGCRVTAHNLQFKLWYVVFTKDGHYNISEALPGAYEVSALEEQYDSPVRAVQLAPAKSETVNLSVKQRPPDASATYLDYDELYPPGPARDLLEKTCTECHGGDFFSSQHRTEAGWRAGVNVMTYGPSFHNAPVLGRTQLSASDKNTIIRYLTDNFGPNSVPRQLKHDPYPADEEALSKAIYVEYDAPDMPLPHASEQIMDDAAIVLGGTNHLLHDSWIAPDGHIWLTSSAASEIVRLDPRQLNPEARWKQFPISAPDVPRGVYPHGLTMDSKGHVYWAESMGGRVGELDPATGKTTRYRLPTEGSLLQVVIDQHDNVWYGQIQGSSIGKIDSQTREVSQWGTPTADSSPYGMAVDQKGNIWTSSFGKGLVIKFDPEVEVFTEYTPPTPYGGARRIGVDSKGVVWFSQYRLGQIGSLNPASGAMNEYKLPMRYTHSYETWPDRDDNIWVTDHFNDSIIKFEQDAKKFTYFPLPQLRWSVPKIEVEKNNTIWFGSRGVPHVVAVHFYPNGYSASAPPEP